jgi:hypothetical protein
MRTACMHTHCTMYIGAMRVRTCSMYLMCVCKCSYVRVCVCTYVMHVRMYVQVKVRRYVLHVMRNVCNVCNACIPRKYVISPIPHRPPH